MELHGVGGADHHAVFQGLDHLRRVLQRQAHRFEHVIHEHDHGLAFDHGLAGGADLVVLDVLRGDFLLLGQIGVCRLHIFFEIERLVLQGMGQFVGQHRLLLVDAQPVEKIHGPGFGIVVSRDLLFQQRHQKRPQVEVSGQQPKFLEHQLGAAQALGIFVLAGVLGDIGFHFIAADQLALDLVLDGKQRVFAGKAQNLVHRAEEFLRFLWRNLLLFG